MLFWGTLFLCVCVSQVLGEPRSNIVGGRNATVKRYSYQVSLRMNNWHFCGGSIISPTWVISAAHCAKPKYIPKTKIHVGTQYRFSDSGTVYEVAKVVTHNFSFAALTNDIALYQLKTPIEFSERVQPIRLANTPPPPGIMATVTGWGFSNQQRTERSDQLKALRTEVISFKDCKKYDPIDPKKPNSLVETSNVCTLNTSNEGFCQGDSGGPLVAGDTQIGVVSFNGEACALNKPDVYASVAYFRDWIRETTGV